MKRNTIVQSFKSASALAITIVVLGSCTPGQTPTSMTTAGSSAVPATKAPLGGGGISLSKAPKLGETADLTYNIKILDVIGFGQPKESLTNSRAWVEFVWANTQGSYSEAKYGVQVPPKEVLVSGNLTWTGNALDIRDINVASTIQLPREGYWIVYGYFSGEDWTRPYKSRMAVVVTSGAAAVVGTPEFEPLAYLGNFAYGEVGRPTLDERHPVTVELDISKAPRVGEEATLTFRFASDRDLPQFRTVIRFFRMPDDISSQVGGWDLLTTGEAQQEFPLKSNEPLQLSYKVRFPIVGDWQINGEGNPQQIIGTSGAGFADNINITVEHHKGWFGWKVKPSPPVTFPPGMTETGIPLRPGWHQEQGKVNRILPAQPCWLPLYSLVARQNQLPQCRNEQFLIKQEFGKLPEWLAPESVIGQSA
jgi:hypothetical protein